MRLFRLLLSGIALLGALALAGCEATPAASSADTSPAERSTAAAAVSAAPTRLGTAWGEPVRSRLGRADLRRIVPSPIAVGVLSYSANPPQGARIPDLRMAGDQLALRVLDENGRPFPMARQGDRGQVQGRIGERYVLEYRNFSNRDIFEIVTTVDGLDVVSGRPGSTRNPGHVLRPGESVRIAGFRATEGAVAAFRFSDVADSYAARSPAGSARNAGVIGTAVFPLAEPDPLDCRRPPCAFGPGAAGDGFADPPPG